MINPQPIHSNTSPYKVGRQLPKNLPSSLSGALLKPKRSWKSVVLWLTLFVVTAIATFAYAEYRSFRKNSIISGEGGSNGLLQYDPNGSTVGMDWSKFQKPGDGRFNVLVLGIGGINDSGLAHDGTLLTDSIQVVSLDTVNKKVSFTSIPRDLYTNIPGYGASKINAVYEIAETAKAGTGGQAARAAMGKVLGINISNFVLVDFTAARELVDQVGGIDINVPNSLYDSSFPCDDEVNYCPYSISAGMHHMDGKAALKYMRTRHADSDFGRSSRQQQVVAAVKSKALSLGTLSNPVTVNGLIQILSKHVKTDMQPSEITQFIAAYKGVVPTDTVNNVLSTDEKLGLLTDSTLAVAGYVEYPLLGYTNYDAVRQWFAKSSPDPFLSKEGASLSVAVSPRATTKQGQAFVQKLKDYGFNVTVVPLPSSLNMPSVTTAYSAVSDVKPVTAHYLANVIGAELKSGKPLSSATDFEVVYVPVQTYTKGSTNQ